VKSSKQHPAEPANAAVSAESGLRIVLTGGPGGGKTTAADLFRRELGEQVVVVPEAASMLFNGGFPRYDEPSAIRAAQRAIYGVQRNLEDMQLFHYPGRILLCDRGTVDGVAYWPVEEDANAFFEAVESTLESELARYDAVIFFESAAVGGMGIEGGNPARIENLDEAVDLDRRLQDIWSQHPHYTLVPNNKSFFKKITMGLAAIEAIVERLRRERNNHRAHP